LVTFLHGQLDDHHTSTSFLLCAIYTVVHTPIFLQNPLKHATTSAPELLHHPVAVSNSSFLRRHSDTSVIRLCKHDDQQNLCTKSSFDDQMNHWTDYQIDQAPELELDWFEPEFDQ